MKLTTITLILTGAYLLVASPAFSEPTEYARSGPYVGGNVVGGSYARIDSAAGDPEADVAPGFKVYGGYRISPAFAIEIEYEMLANADIEVNGVKGIAEIETWIATANAKIFWMHDRIQPYTLIGMGIMNSNIDDSVGLGISASGDGFTFRFGAGLDYYVTRSVVASVGADYVLPAGSELEDLDLVTYGMGIQYRF